MSTSKICVLNVGLYRTGSTSFAAAAAAVGWNVYRKFPDVPPHTHQVILKNPTIAVIEWWNGRGTKAPGRDQLLELVRNHDLVGDGYVSLLPFLPKAALKSFVDEARSGRIDIVFVATQRSLDELVQSELHHWVQEGLEAKADLSLNDRSALEDYLRCRGDLHARLLEVFPYALSILRLENHSEWGSQLAASISRRLSGDKPADWAEALRVAGQQNRSPPRPIEGILLTMRIGKDSKIAATKVQRLLAHLTVDRLCKYQVIFAVDFDEADFAESVLQGLRSSHVAIDVIVNPNRPTGSPFPICKIWDQMARKAFELGADWVVLLGDDVEIDCPFHGRAFYHAFVEISKRLKAPLWFGCPWWNDESFPGFPTFPAVGRVHYEIFGSLIPKHRSESFINQDLDPYLQRLYLKFGAAPLVREARMRNEVGGDTNVPRYHPVYAPGWRDWVIQDVDPIRHFLESKGCNSSRMECCILDVVVPSYRINTKNLEAVCSLPVPQSMRTSFIIIIDNPSLLKEKMGAETVIEAQQSLERYLAETCGPNNIRVRCNETNSGASASRNRGLDESSAEYVLFLDDDIIPEENLLSVYQEELKDNEKTTAGLIGLTKFPRSSSMPVLHAAVLMSYLVYVFEIASSPMYKNPAWGVTANILVKRIPEARFDTAYAKTGGGEDVDFCLKLLEHSGGQLRSVPSAQVVHEFWPGGLKVLLPHFFNWAVGDGALFQRHVKYTYASWPNAVEFFIVLFPFLLVIVPMMNPNGAGTLASLITTLVLESLLLFLADFVVEASNLHEFQHRIKLLGKFKFSPGYYLAAHMLGNFYVFVLESGRLYGHWKRGEVAVNFARRFDWHCGRLKNASQNFVRRERHKFILFTIVTVVVLFRGIKYPMSECPVAAPVADRVSFVG